jgi:hypothetical protein
VQDEFSRSESPSFVLNESRPEGVQSPKPTAIVEEQTPDRGISLKTRLRSHHNFQEYIKTLRDSSTLETLRKSGTGSGISGQRFKSIVRRSGIANTLTSKTERESPNFKYASKNESDAVDMSCAEEGLRQAVQNGVVDQELASSPLIRNRSIKFRSLAEESSYVDSFDIEAECMANDLHVDDHLVKVGDESALVRNIP